MFVAPGIVGLHCYSCSSLLVTLVVVVSYGEVPVCQGEPHRQACQEEKPGSFAQYPKSSGSRSSSDGVDLDSVSSVARIGSA